ncbi:hypothetical protein TNCV_3458481 [Trichonephila clavipes]|nr:hypothetical protein TNCV_3458481 [Trichonephila clavipes]
MRRRPTMRKKIRLKSRMSDIDSQKPKNSVFKRRATVYGDLCSREKDKGEIPSPLSPLRQTTVSFSSLLGSKRFRSSLAMLPVIAKRRSQGKEDPTILKYIMAIEM